MRLSRLADDLPQVADLELDPVIARPYGAHVVDARVRRAGAGAGGGRAAGAGVRAAQPQQRRGKGKSTPSDAHLVVLAGAAPGREPAVGAAGRRRPGGAAHLAGGPAGDHGGLYCAGRPAACAAADRRRHRSPGARKALPGQGPCRAGRGGCPPGARREQAVLQAEIRRRPSDRPGRLAAEGQPRPAAGHRR